MTKPTTTTTPEPITPTAAAQFRRAGVYRLPSSGNVVQLRWPGLRALALTGVEQPNPITVALRRVLADVDAATKQPDEAAIIEQWRNSSLAFLANAERCLAKPRLVLERAPDYEADEIGPGDLSESDIIWLWIWAQEGPTDARIAPFRLDGPAQP
jgi:hypothetical protein